MDQSLRRRRRDSGQGTLQYVGMIALAAIIIVSVVANVRPAVFAGMGFQAVCTVKAALPGGGAGGMCAAASGPDGQSPGGDEDQPWYCELFGLGCNDTDNTGGGAGGGGGGGGGGSIGDDPPWYCQFFGIGCPDGGNGGGNQQDPQVDIPKGLDPDSDLVKTLLSTQRGRETLQWLSDHDIPITTDPDQQGAVWNGSEILLGPGFDNAAVLVHETNHAKYTDEGRSADPMRLDHDAYVKAAIDEEADGTVQQILAAKEFRDAGHKLDPQPSEEQYDAAYQAVKKGGGSDADAQKAGAKAVNDSFYNGTVVTSNTHQSYPDYYGDYWDSVH
jgi:hypothetical protein